jgi:hypothetical protein
MPLIGVCSSPRSPSRPCSRPRGCRRLPEPSPTGERPRQRSTAPQPLEPPPGPMTISAPWGSVSTPPLPPRPRSPRRPQSPDRLAASASTSGGVSAAVQAPKAAGYVPPHQRAAAATAGGGATGRASAVGGGPKPQFSLAFDANDRPGKVTAARQQAAGRAQQGPAAPPGLYHLPLNTFPWFPCLSSPAERLLVS